MHTALTNTAAMNTALWIIQGILAAVFTVSGAMKLTMSKDRMLATGQTGVVDYPLPAIRMIALSEIAGVLGLIVPGLMGLAPWLTPLAALGLAGVMMGAAVAHGLLHETRNVAVNAVLFTLCLWVAIGRSLGL